MLFFIMVLGYLIVGASNDDPLYHIAAGVWMLVTLFANGFSIRR